MKTVKIYIETTITGPAAPKRGGYAAALTFTRRNGDSSMILTWQMETEVDADGNA